MKFFWNKKKRNLNCTFVLNNSDSYTKNNYFKSIFIKIRHGIWSLILLIFLVFWISFTCKQNHVFPVNKVQITASIPHVDQKQLQQILDPYLQSGFFIFNAKELSSRLMGLPWIHSVIVQRVWPDRISILLDEQKPIAKWNNGSLINTDGEVFTPSKDTIPKNLPQLFGADEDLYPIMDNYFLLESLLKPLGYSITQLTVDQYHNWYLILNNGLYLFLGQNNIISRLKVFVTVYPKIKSQGKTARKIDLRYNNGLSIDWGN